jgi:hypothetical protein
MKTPLSETTASKAMARTTTDDLNGHDLLDDLRGNNGPIMRSVAVGYVRALYESTTFPRGPVQRSDSHPAPATFEQAVSAVESWLEAHATRCDEGAVPLVNAALEQFSPRVHRSAVAPSVRVTWSHRVRRVGAIAALCVVAGVCGWSLGSQFGARSGPSAHDVQLSQSAERIVGLMLEERRYEKDLFINIDDRDRFESYAQKWQDARTGLFGELARAEKLNLSEQDRKALLDVEVDLRSYAWGYQRVLVKIRNGAIRTPQAANDEFARFKGAAHRIEAACAAIAERAQLRAARLS